MPTAAIITDNDFDKVSGVTTTLKAIIRHAPRDWRIRVYTAADVEVNAPGYRAMASWGIGLPRYPQMRIYWPHVQRLRRLLSDDDVDLVHITTPGPVGLAARWVHRRQQRPLVGSYHTHLGDYVAAYSGSPALGRAFEMYMRWFYAPCGSVLVPSGATRDLLIGRGYPSSALKVWSRGVDITRFSPAAASAIARKEWRADDGRMTVLYAGRLSREKGLAMMPALQQALARRGVPFRLVFVGDGPMRPTLEAVCPDAAFTGSLPAAGVARAMASADAFVFPSTTDSLGNVVLEAQASGCPVLVTDEGGPRQQMQHGITGWVCPAGDADMFADRLADWWQHPDHRRQMAAAAVAHARIRNWPDSLQPLFEAWREALTHPVSPLREAAR